VAAVPSRARRAEAALVGRPFAAATIEASAEVLSGEFTPIDDLRATAAYRRRVLGNLLRRFWHETGATHGAPVRLADAGA